jgi:hypothetical protein
VEEEVKSNLMTNRPTVYAGMQGKLVSVLERHGSSQDSSTNTPNHHALSINGVRSPESTTDTPYTDLVLKYVEKSID